MQTKTLWIKNRYLEQILAGQKTVEVRVGYSNIARLQIGDQLLLNDRYPCTIKRIGRYKSFAEMLNNEDPTSIAPDIPADELLSRIRSLYPPDKEALGVVALEVEPV